MPLVFHAACADCGYEAADLSPGGFAVLVPDAETDSPPILGRHHPPVLHPFAPFVLDEFGLSFATAAWGGQLVERETVVCRECGRVFERRRLTAAGAAVGCGGCLAIAGGAFAVAVVVGLVTGNPFVGAGAGAVVAVAAGAVAEFGASAFVRRRFRERAATVDTPRTCPDCGGRRVARVGSNGGPFPCPACGRRAVRIVPVAKP
jgi:ribosomal protein L37AE/L43A